MYKFKLRLLSARCLAIEHDLSVIERKAEAIEKVSLPLECEALLQFL